VYVYVVRCTCRLSSYQASNYVGIFDRLAAFPREDVKYGTHVRTKLARVHRVRTFVLHMYHGVAIHVDVDSISVRTRVRTL
jgi:hypothetical protein